METSLTTALINCAAYLTIAISGLTIFGTIIRIVFNGSLDDNDAKRILFSAFALGLAVIIYIATPPHSLFSAPVSEQSGGGLTIDTSAESTENMDVEEEEPVEDPMFTATGFYDSSLSKTEKMYLVNDAENQIGDLTVYLQYVVSEGDKTVYETDLIEPGKFVEWIPGESLDVGEHEVSILEQPYTLENGEFVPKFSCVQNIKITIEE